MVEEESKEG
jgi:hypothetical protein